MKLSAGLDCSRVARKLCAVIENRAEVFRRQCHEQQSSGISRMTEITSIQIAHRGVYDG